MIENKKYLSRTISLGFLLSIVALGVGIISIIGYREEWWRQFKAFYIFGWATFIAIASLIILLIGIFKNFKNKQKKIFALSVVSILFNLPILTGAFLFNYTATLYPPINDISTDTKDPPSYWNMPSPMEYPEEKFASMQHEFYPDLIPLKIKQNPKKVFEKALKIVKNDGWKLVSKDEEEGQIEAVASSLFFGFKDEVVIRIKKSKDGTIVDVRSRSRIGKIDRGANARRIRKFIKALKE